jgi:hypothetical protein
VSVSVPEIEWHIPSRSKMAKKWLDAHQNPKLKTESMFFLLIIIMIGQAFAGHLKIIWRN